MSTKWERHKERRRAFREDRMHFVYLVRDAAGVVLYVGRTCHPEQRWANHVANPEAQWTEDAATFQMIGPVTYAAALRLERDEIRKHDPAGNWVHTSRYYHRGAETRRNRKVAA